MENKTVGSQVDRDRHAQTRTCLIYWRQNSQTTHTHTHAHIHVHTHIHAHNLLGIDGKNLSFSCSSFGEDILSTDSFFLALSLSRAPCLSVACTRAPSLSFFLLARSLSLSLYQHSQSFGDDHLLCNGVLALSLFLSLALPPSSSLSNNVMVTAGDNHLLSSMGERDRTRGREGETARALSDYQKS